MMLIDNVITSTMRIKKELNVLEKIIRDSPTSGPTLQIKNPTILQELVSVSWHKQLLEVISWLSYKFRGRIYFTSGYRDEDGIHGTKPLRAIDLRSRVFDNPIEVRDLINLNWYYGKDNYQVCMYHRTATCRRCGNRFDIHITDGITMDIQCRNCGSTTLIDNGVHFHIQVRDETKQV